MVNAVLWLLVNWKRGREVLYLLQYLKGDEHDQEIKVRESLIIKTATINENWVNTSDIGMCHCALRSSQ